MRFRPTIQQRFEAFHQKNPQVFTWFRRFATELLDAGHDRLSADLLIHRVRYEVARNWPKSDGYGINNNLVASYARELMKEERFAGVFETRRRKAV